MEFIYKNYSEPSDRVYNGLPYGVILEVNAPTIRDADKVFAAKFGFKMSDPRASCVATWSPEWSSNSGCQVRLPQK